MIILKKAIKRVYLRLLGQEQRNTVAVAVALSGHEPSMLIEQVDDLDDLFAHIQNSWETMGKTEPYWSVLTDDRFMSSGKGTRKEFYDTGKGDADRLFNTLTRNGINYSSLKTCLEFGCGLGRVTYWLAKRLETVTGYDISREHLSLAQQYLDQIDHTNVQLKHLDKIKDLQALPKVDLVFSLLVLQHNPPPIISIIIRELIRALNHGGIAVFQVPTYRKGYTFILSEYLANEMDNDDMEMHVLPQNEIFNIVVEEHARVVEVLEDHCTGPRAGERSNTFVVQKI